MRKVNQRRASGSFLLGIKDMLAKNYKAQLMEFEVIRLLNVTGLHYLVLVLLGD